MQKRPDSCAQECIDTSTVTTVADYQFSDQTGHLCIAVDEAG
jgi:hypothetical protein